MQFQHGKTNQTFNVNNKGCRTQEQYKAFINYFENNSHSFLCLNPFKVDFPNESYNCTFAVYYYNSTNLKMIKITPKGKIKIVR